MQNSEFRIQNHSWKVIGTHYLEAPNFEFGGRLKHGHSDAPASLTLRYLPVGLQFPSLILTLDS
jgi:hypothetical protein